MKGIIFTEFLEFSEQRIGTAALESVIMRAALPHGGAYTAVGTYDHRELVTLVQLVSQSSGISSSDLLRQFGQHLFHTLAQLYPQLVGPVRDAFELLSNVESVIHVEVLKLYPDAQLPKFTHQRIDSGRMELVYDSERGFSYFAEGLLLGCFEHFQESVRVARTDLSQGAGTRVKFELCRESM